MQVYRIYNLISGKSYIGVTRWTFEKRYHNGIWWKWTHNKHLKNSVNKYGLDFFNWEILWEGRVEEGELSDLEKIYIKQYDSLYPNGYNLTIGGLDPSDWNYKEYELIDCFGNTHLVVNLREFCRNNNLNYGAMCNMATNLHPVSQGYALSTFKGKIPNPNKAIKLENIKTGEIEEFFDKDSSSWAEERKLNKKSIRALILKKQKVHKDWKLLETDLSNYKSPKPEKIVLKDPNGNLLEIDNLYRFCKKNNLDRGRFYKLKNGKSLSAYGYTLPMTKEDFYKEQKNRLGKKAKLISPKGEVVEVKNISEFCRKNNLSNQGIYAIIKGRIKTHKGWKRHE